MTETQVHVRTAAPRDLPVLRSLADRAIAELQRNHLDPEQIEASRSIMGVDSRLVADGTYLVAEVDGTVAGCGGWSRRATLYGGDHTSGRDDALLDPLTDAAKVRAMYTAPAFARRGVGRAILDRCLDDAARAGFRRVELMSTLAGQPLYRSAGFTAIEHVMDDRAGVAIPLVRMARDLTGGPVTPRRYHERSGSGRIVH